MPTLVPSEYRHHSRHQRNFNALYGAIVILGLHWALVVYINSSYLGQFISDAAIGVLYTTSSAITILAFLFISRVLQKAGNYYLTLSLALLEFATLLGMATAESLRVAIPLFMIHQAIVPLILFNLDVYMEEMIGKKERSTGGRRGLLLALMSFAGVLSPLIAGNLLGDNSPHYSYAYVASALLIIPFIMVIMRYFRTFDDPVYKEIKVLPSIRSFWIRPDIRNAFLAHFLLQFFFTWMVIYTPIYLTKVVGFSWIETGMIISVAMMAYLIFEYPIGVIADKWIGEKEMMAFGFLLMGVATSWFVFMEHAPLAAWMLVMFMTRVGASFVETTTESYFFKHIDGSDANAISFFRITRPLSYVFGALIGSLLLLYLPFNLLFVILGLLMVTGLFHTMALHDTR